MLENLEFGNHWLVYLGPLSVHMDTLLMAWMAMLILVVLSFFITRKLTRVPDKLQAFSEMVMEFVEGIAVGQMGKEGYKHVAIIASLFLFILVSNIEGQLPWRLIHLKTGELASPTNDINVTAALALVVSIYYFGAGISKFGLNYFKHYLQPLWFMAPFNLLEDFTRPLSLSVRLFANILAGEVILLVIITFVPLIMPMPMMLFELFVAGIQAFIFAVLAASYIAGAISEHH